MNTGPAGTLTTITPDCRLLGKRLRELRVAAGVTGERAAGRIGCSPSKISRLEKGRTPPGDCLEPLLLLYKVPGPVRTELRRLAENTRSELGDQDYTITVLAWSEGVIPVPLCTAEYRRAVLSAGRRVTRMPPSEMKAAVAIPGQWQTRIRAGALTVSCILDEAVLTRQRGPAMAAQLDLLGELGELPFTDIRILPAGAEGPAFPSFTYLGFNPGDDASIVTLATPAGDLRLDEDHTVYLYRCVFDDLAATAAGPGESAAMIKTAAGRWS